MLGFLKNYICPIGIDICDDRVKLAQLENGENGVMLLANASREKPADIAPGSSQWQKWVIDTIQMLIENNTFKGREIISSVPANDIFIDHLKTPKEPKHKIEEAFLSKIKQRLPYDPQEAMLKYINADEDNSLVMVMQRQKINRHLAIYEHANLNIKTMNVWPLAIANTYVKFFGRRKSDQKAVVFVVDIEPNNSSVVICRHLNVLFARSISIGSDSFTDEDSVKRFVLELIGCRRHFSSMYHKAKIERMLFLSNDNMSTAVQNTFAAIARQIELPAQMGNCMAAVDLSQNNSNPERKSSNFSWATAFGLSLSCNN